MFWLGFSIGLMVGSTVGLFIYALIFTAKRADELIENGGKIEK